MNHHDRLTKAYRGLNADQSAALAFHYISEGNALEFKRLGDAVPRKDYNCPDVAYQARLDGFTRFAACWAIEHWRLRCHKAEMLGAALAAGAMTTRRPTPCWMPTNGRKAACWPWTWPWRRSAPSMALMPPTCAGWPERKPSSLCARV